MDIAVRHAEGRVVWELKGDLDSEGARALRRTVKSADALAGEVVVDLTGVPFVDSAGVAALIGLAWREQERRVIVTGACRPVFRVLVMTGVDRQVEVRPAVDDGDGHPDATSGGPPAQGMHPGHEVVS